ncbi:MAG: hypothetical protein EA398_05975 [Deltaproteobacteria bacterium]|nr:MAG: hypothetical protein EA398_05975 [Deltaproteobacteria bacterium]
MTGRHTSRTLAAQVVTRVCEDRAFSQRALASAFDAAPLEGRERAFATRLVYGTLTHLGRIDRILDGRLKKGLGSLKPALRDVLRVAVYQLVHEGEHVPPFAAVNEAVGHARARHGRGAGNLVNAVLRGLQRDIERSRVGPPESPAEEHGLRPWMWDLLVAQRGEEASEVMKVFNAPSPLHLRARSGDAAALVEELGSCGVEASVHPIVPGCAVCRGGEALRTAPVADGRAVVQDAGSQTVSLLVPHDALRVLDACAGIGGKTRHLLDLVSDRAVTSADIHARKLAHLAQRVDEIDRLDTVRWTLPSDPPEAVRGSWDAVVLDAPCSALGTLGRHPEVRWTRSPGQVATLAALQAQMLDALAPLVGEGGVLVYAVCTFTPEEGLENVRSFLGRWPSFRACRADEVPSSLQVGLRWDDSTGGVRLWPDLHGTDGFQIFRLHRRS